MNNDFAQILNDMNNTVISLLLGILGIAITIFTVIYSFMEGAKQKLKDLDIAIQQSTDTDPRRSSEYQFVKSYLVRLRKMNRWILGLIVGDVVVFSLFFVHILESNNCVILVVSFITLGLYLLLCLIVFIVYVWQYRNRFKYL